MAPAPVLRRTPSRCSSSDISLKLWHSPRSRSSGLSEKKASYPRCEKRLAAFASSHSISSSSSSSSADVKLQYELDYPVKYDAAFHLGTSFLLVPAYLALLFTSRPKRQREREREREREGKKGVVDLLWSPSNKSGGSVWKWCLSVFLPVVLGSLFLALLVADTDIFLSVVRRCWRGEIPALQRLLQNPATVVQIWSQITLLDFLVARYVLNDSLERGIPCKHSVVLCFVVGPAGLISHLVTKTWMRRRK